MKVLYCKDPSIRPTIQAAAAASATIQTSYKENSSFICISGSDNDVDSFLEAYQDIGTIESNMDDNLVPFNEKLNPLINPLTNRTNPWFFLNELSSLYNYPSPPSTKKVVGVISLGGGLYGTYNSNTGLLTNGDSQLMWSRIGISASNFPTILINTVDGAINIPGNDSGTAENIIDVTTVGGVCPTSNLTIILYLAPNTYMSFYNAIYEAVYGEVYYNNTYIKPSIISISWGAIELYWPPNFLNEMNILFSNAANLGINICIATGDSGSSNSYNGGYTTNTMFPASSPFVTACGGTTLSSPTAIYNANTVETAWSLVYSDNVYLGGGGGFSQYFSVPSYQSNLGYSMRGIPDISLNANPNTGVVFYVNSTLQIYGGTSVAAPLFAGYLACTNINYFINPYLYNFNSNCFRDIISGTNGAYPAITGYDLSTGLGSINGCNLTPAINAIRFTPPQSSNLYIVNFFELGNPYPLQTTVSTNTQVTATFTPVQGKSYYTTVTPYYNNTRYIIEASQVTTY